MPFVTMGGLSIHFEAEGTGPALVLHHGFSQRGDAWRSLGYSAALAKDRRLVLLDARGHGRSDKPHEPAAYDLQARVRDVLAVLDALGIERADFLGYSMGAWVGFGLAQFAPNRIRSLIAGGAHPFADSSWHEAFRLVDPLDPDAFLRAFESVIGDRIPGQARPLVLANDLEALAASATDRPPTMEALASLRAPRLLYAGERDRRHDLVLAAAEQANATFFSVPGVGHVETFMRPELTLPGIQSFLSSLHARGAEDAPALP